MGTFPEDAHAHFHLLCNITYRILEGSTDCLCSVSKLLKQRTCLACEDVTARRVNEASEYRLLPCY